MHELDHKLDHKLRKPHPFLHIKYTEKGETPRLKMAANLEVDAFLELAESTVSFLKYCYEEDVDQNIKDDAIDFSEQVLHFGFMVIDFDAMHQFVALMRSEKCLWST